MINNSTYIRCAVCKGRGKFASLGGIEHDCNHCEGAGRIEVDNIVDNKKVEVAVNHVTTPVPIPAVLTETVSPPVGKRGRPRKTIILDESLLNEMGASK